MIGIRTAARVLGELRRDVAAAHERDPAARGVSRARDPRHVARRPRAAVPPRRPRAHEAGVPLAPRAIAAARAHRDRDRDPPVRRHRRRPLHRPRHGRRDRRDRRDRRERDALPGRDARRHRLRGRQAPPDGRGQRHDRLGREAARPDPDRPRREDRRQRGRRPRRAAELDRGRQPRPPGAGRGPQARGARRRLGPPARPDRRRAEGALHADRGARSASSTRARGQSGSRAATSCRCGPCAGRTPPAGSAVRRARSCSSRSCSCRSRRPPPPRAMLDAAAEALKSDPVYVDPDAVAHADPDARPRRSAPASPTATPGPMYVAVMPAQRRHARPAARSARR